MEINFHSKDVILTSKQKAYIEKKIAKLKKYFNGQENVVIDVHLNDESSPERGGVDQKVTLSTVLGKEKIFLEEVSDRTMRAFAIAFKRFEREIRKLHEKTVESRKKVGESRLEKVWNKIKRK
jgi:ribosomal subunit interface protein